MNLPEYVRLCVEKLEGAGFAAYAVGGCVRDDCLGRQPHDFDLCTSALPEQTEQVFRAYPMLTDGKKHGTIRVVVGAEVVEITTFRAEGTYSDNRHPDWVAFVDRVEEDLARRDFTVNAMAWSPTRGYADPFGGRQDLQNQLLRAVGDPEVRFREDSLRILRGIRFAARYGLQVEPETEKAMFSLAPLLANLSGERIFEELSRILPTVTAADMLRFAPIFTAVIPELAPMVGFDQRSPHHAYDLYTHVAHVVAGVPADTVMRWAALLHDIGKIPTATVDETGRGHYYGHAAVGAKMAGVVLQRLKAPAALREQVVILIENHMNRLRPDKKQLRRCLSRLGWETVEQSLALQEADMNSKGMGHRDEQEQLRRVYTLLGEIRQEKPCLTVRDLAINGRDLIALGLRGKEVGQALQKLLEQVLDETLKNEKEALLEQLAADWDQNNGG